MERNEALRALSHQRHQGLFVGLQLKRVRQESAADARKDFLDCFERGSSHFRAEEELLLPAFARHTGVDDPAIVRVLREHADLPGRAQDLERSADPDPAALHVLGERLESHIRFEERVLFPMIEEALSLNELARLGAAFALAEADHE